MSDSIERRPSNLAENFQNANAPSNTNASMTSPITPFSQSTLPPKSNLSRDEETFIDGEDTVENLQPTSVSLNSSTIKALHAVIRRIFERCFQDGMYRQVVGIAVEARNLGILRETITRAGETSNGAAKTRGRVNTKDELMDYLLDICMGIVQERSFRNEVRAFVSLLQQTPLTVCRSYT